MTDAMVAEDPLDRPRILVDFNEMVEANLVLLAKQAEVVDSSGERITLYEGLRVYMYQRDADDEGKPGFLVATGLVERNVATDWSAHVPWCCRIDAWEHVSASHA